jgi:dATP pyrophosphohydrolase
MSTDPQRRYKRPESVLVLVYTRAGDVLLLRRSDFPDFWQSVTGSLEWGEIPAEAAPRELAEETGIRDVDLLDHQLSHTFMIFPRWRARYAQGVTQNLEHLFSIELPTRVPVQLAPEEHTEFVWLPREAALARASSWTNREAIRLCVPPDRPA